MNGESLPLISVIIPAYNAGLTIKETIESIEAQTYNNLEIIVVDDASKDETVAIVETLGETYENIRLLENQGKKSVSAGRNYGIENSRGELIMFVDADDRILPDMVETLYSEMMVHNADVCGCSFFTWRVNEDYSSTACNTKCKIKDNEIICEYDSKRYLNDEFIAKNNTRCWAKLYKKSAIDNVRFDENLVIGEDALFLVNLIGKNLRFCELEYQGYGYYQNPNGAMNRPFEPKYMDQITCWERIREEAVKIDESSEKYITRNLLMSIMLVVGKLSKCDKKTTDNYQKYLKICKEKVRFEVSNREAFKLLDSGYQFKIKLFNRFPGLYSWLYHLI